MMLIAIMHNAHLVSTDLNLLVALDALLRERHVTRAARAVGLSQSAMSHALRRLRAVFGDPLLVRGATGMVATPRAEALEAPLRELLEGAEALLARSPAFDPSTAAQVFTLASEDFVSALLVPDLLGRLRAEAPRCDLDVAPYAKAVMLDRLERSELDLAVGVYRELPASIRVQTLFEEDYACVVREGHPRVKRRLTFRQYVDLPHALIGVGERGAAPVDTALAALGERRRVLLRVGHFLAAPLIVAQSDLILTLPRRLANRLARMAPLVLHEPPVEIPGFRVSQLWHERRQRDPAHVFLRRTVAEVAAHV
ncbi:MAG: LysR family transcriptional regulator [Sandaracinaceae bacterium]|nr:LysR family transcriptional regulator [Sandaracinaceae bacterium]